MLFLIIALLVPITAGSAQYANAPGVSDSTRFRVVIAAALSTSVDVYLDGAITPQSALAAVKPLNASGYIVTVAGPHAISLTQTGTPTPVGVPLDTTFVAGTNYTVVLLGDLTWLVFPDVNNTPAAGQFNARVINVSPNNDPVAVSFDDTIPTEFNGIAYQSSSSSYFTGAIGGHTLAIPGSAAKTVTYNFLDGHVYSIYVFWDPTANAPVILPKTDATFATVTPTVGVTVPPTPTATVTPVSTVVAPAPIHLWIPVVQNMP